MGRGKLSLNLIQNRKCRSSTFKKRKSNLMKKAYELSTLCEVPVCVLIHGGDDDRQLHTWPPNRTDVHALLRACAKNPNLHKRKSFDLSDFFEDRRAKLLADTCKLREKLLCPNPNPNPTETYLHCLNESQLRAFLDSLDSKLEAASAMLDLVEPNQLLPMFTPFSPLDDTHLLQSPFVEDDPDQLCFDDLQSLFPEFDHNSEDFKQSQILMNNEFDYNFEDLVMPGKDEFEFGRGDQLEEYGKRKIKHYYPDQIGLFPELDHIHSNDHFEFQIDNNLDVMSGNDEFEFVKNMMMPANCVFELIGNSLDFEPMMTVANAKELKSTGNTVYSPLDGQYNPVLIMIGAIGERVRVQPQDYSLIKMGGFWIIELPSSLE